MAAHAYLNHTPFTAAREGIGADLTAFIVRYKLDGGRCGMVQVSAEEVL